LSRSPCRVPAHRWLAWQSQSESTTQASTVLPRSQTDEPATPARHIRRVHSDDHGELQEEAILGCNRDRIRTITMGTHAHATGGGCPGEIQQLRAAHMHSAWAAQQTYSFPGRAVRTSAGRGRSVASVRCEDVGAHLPTEYDGFEAVSSCAQQPSISYQPMPALGGTEASNPRHTPNFYAIAGRTRSNAKARRILHSRNDACTFKTCAAAGIPQNVCRTLAASSHFRRCSQYSRRGGWWLELALGFRNPRLLTCGIQSQHAVCAH
jgi:hypothetical protein